MNLRKILHKINFKRQNSSHQRNSNFQRNIMYYANDSTDSSSHINYKKQPWTTTITTSDNNYYNGWTPSSDRLQQKRYRSNNNKNLIPTTKFTSSDQEYNTNKSTRKTFSMKEKKGQECYTSSEFKKSFADYCERSSLHGLRYVGDEKITIAERSFWCFSFAIAVAVAAYFISNIYTKWSISPVIISLNPVFTELTSIPFPAITICNMNQAKRHVAETILENGTEVEKRLLEDFCDTNSSFSDPGSFQTNQQSGDWEVVKQFMIKVGQSCREMLHACFWRSEEIICDDYFNAGLTDEGLCCSFNKVHKDFLFRSPADYGDLNQTYVIDPYVNWTPERGFLPNESLRVTPLRAEAAGTHLGLTLVLDAQIDDYYCSSTGSAGFKIMLHSPVETPRVKNFGFLVSPGRLTRILIKPQISDATDQLRSVDIDKRQCYFANERQLKFYKTYTQKNCHLECLANITLDHCKCVPYHMPKSTKTRICNRNKENCTNNVTLAISEYSSEREKCNCLPACFEISYGREQSNALIVDTFTIRYDYLKGKKDSYFKKNMAILEFYFDSNKFTKNTKGELFGFTDFLSNTGGLLGLFLGFSFLSAVEILYFITLRVWCHFYRTRNNRKKDTIFPFAK